MLSERLRNLEPRLRSSEAFFSSDFRANHSNETPITIPVKKTKANSNQRSWPSARRLLKTVVATALGSEKKFSSNHFSRVVAIRGISRRPQIPKKSGLSHLDIDRLLVMKLIVAQLTRCHRGSSLDEALDLTAVKGFQKFLVVLDRHAAVRSAVRPEHMAVREQPGPPDRTVAINGKHTERLDGVKQSLPRFQVIDIWWRRSNISLAHVCRIVHQTTQSRMRLELQPVWHVDGARRDVIDGGEIVIAKRRQIRPVAKEPTIGDRDANVTRAGSK